MAEVAILDIDGTLVDTNYQHALAWYRAFRQHGMHVPVWRIHRHIGMGGDQMVEALAGEDTEREDGDEIRAAESALYLATIDEIEPMPGAQELIASLAQDGWTIVMASSGKANEVDHYRKLLDVEQHVKDWTTSADVQNTKPDPDLIKAAIDKAGTDDAVMVGDSVWDCEAAKRAGLESVAVLTGGFCESELRGAGAAAVFETLEELCVHLTDTPLRHPGQAQRS